MSDTIDTIQAEEGLDPQDWDAMRRLGHRMVDDLVTSLERVRERPVWQTVPEASRAFLRQPTLRSPVIVLSDWLENELPDVRALPNLVAVLRKPFEIPVFDAVLRKAMEQWA